MRLECAREKSVIHRHTGGLEKKAISLNILLAIHRHTGGLEIGHTVSEPVPFYSPPHRRLRNTTQSNTPPALNSPPHRRLRKMASINMKSMLDSPPHRRLRK